jgi:hypothetical protein
MDLCISLWRNGFEFVAIRRSFFLAVNRTGPYKAPVVPNIGVAVAPVAGQMHVLVLQDDWCVIQRKTV